VIIFIILFSTISFDINIAENQEITSQDSFFLLKTSNGNRLNYSDLYQNVSSAYRLFDSVLFEINTSKFIGVNSTTMQIEFYNAPNRHYEMDRIAGTEIFSYSYTPEYDAHLGFHNISFIIKDISEVQLNSQEFKTNITIYHNYVTYINATEFARNATVYGEVLVNDFDTYNFGFNATVVDSDNSSISKNLFDLGNDVSHFTFQIDDRFEIPEAYYYVKINISDRGGNKIRATYIPFQILNSVPKIVESSINISSDILKREEECTINLNVTDGDPLTVPENITLTLKIRTSGGVELTPQEFDNNGDWTYSITFSIAKNHPLGLYEIIIEAEDTFGGKGIYEKFFSIENNFPKISNFWINGFSIEEQVLVNYGEDIIFTFNVTDLEDQYPSYVTVSLLDENDNWYNITRIFNENMELVIRTEELITGVWYVYLSVTDSDGDTTRLTSDLSLGPKEIRIIPDLLSPYLNWIALFAGIAIGLLVGLAISYNILKRKQLISPQSTEKKKVVAKKVKKVKKKKEIEIEKPDIEPEEKPKSEAEPQRKIKRRLN
jgi:hypothetical protein